MSFLRGGLTKTVVTLTLSAGWSLQSLPVADWIRANAIRLSTPEAGHGFDDLQPLKKIIGNARIVSLGEATHGSREFFQLKHRLLEFLASEMGFTIFSIEANMPEAYRINDYVLRGSGDPAQLLKSMGFWTWDTEEVLDMILWMRQFNASGKGRVEFTGFDMMMPAAALRIVRTFVERHNPELLGATITLKGDAKVTVELWKEIVATLGKGRARYRADGSADEDIEWAIQNARVVLQGLQQSTGEVSRDRSMADNVKWILNRHPGGKVVLWAHNGHVATGGFQGETMGAALRRLFGLEMFVFGFAFNEGSFQAIYPLGGPLKNVTVPPLQTDSLDATLASAGIPIFALDLRQAPAWFREPHQSRQIGSVYLDGPGVGLVAPDAFDGMLFIEKTTAARKNLPKGRSLR